MFKDILRNLREKRGLSQSELAKIIGVTAGTIGNYEQGTRHPRNATLQALSEYFEVSIDYLLGNNQKNSTYFPSPNTTSDYITFPVIGEIAAGYNTPPLENWEGETIDIPISYLKGRKRSDFFVLEVKGASMYPHYQEGDKVLILSQNTLDYSGQVAAIIYDDDFATLKKVEQPLNKEWLKLVPINPNYETQKIEGEELNHCHILGVPKMLIRDIKE